MTVDGGVGVGVAGAAGGIVGGGSCLRSLAAPRVPTIPAAAPATAASAVVPTGVTVSVLVSVLVSVSVTVLIRVSV